MAINGAQTRLYAANDASPGRIDVFDCSFKPVNLGSDAFKDPSVRSNDEAATRNGEHAISSATVLGA